MLICTFLLSFENHSQNVPLPTQKIAVWSIISASPSRNLAGMSLHYSVYIKNRTDRSMVVRVRAWLISPILPSIKRSVCQMSFSPLKFSVITIKGGRFSALLLGNEPIA